MKRVLVPLTGHSPDRRALVTAFQVSERCRGLVDALCITPHAEVHTPTESTSIPSALLTQLRRIASEEQARVAASARQIFEEVCRQHNRVATEGAGAPTSNQASCRWREETGSAGDILPEEARLADLVVMAQDETARDLGAPGIEAVLFGSGRALLLAPTVRAGVGRRDRRHRVGRWPCGLPGRGGGDASAQPCGPRRDPQRRSSSPRPGVGSRPLGREPGMSRDYGCQP